MSESQERAAGVTTPMCTLCTNKADLWTQAYGWICNTCHRSWDQFRSYMPRWIEDD